VLRDAQNRAYRDVLLFWSGIAPAKACDKNEETLGSDWFTLARYEGRVRTGPEIPPQCRAESRVRSLKIEHLGTSLSHTDTHFAGSGLATRARL